MLVSISEISPSATAFSTSSELYFSTIAVAVFGLEAETEGEEDCFGFDNTMLLDYFWLTICFET